MGSTRLPGKAIAEIYGKPLIEHVFERVKMATKLDQVCLATTYKEEDNVLAEIAGFCDVAVVRGPEQDVLDRYVRAAKTTKAEVIVRVTGDCPFIDPDVINSVVEKMFFSPGQVYLQYVTTGQKWPDGLDTEAIRYEALKYADMVATLPSDREHPTMFTRRTATETLTWDLDVNLGHHRWTVDTETDLEFVRTVWPLLPKNFRWRDVLNLVESKPELSQINKGQTRDEGYKKSLANDPK